jgi:hypothetical protein
MGSAGMVWSGAKVGVFVAIRKSVAVCFVWVAAISNFSVAIRN